MVVDDFFNPHRDAAFDLEPDPESGSYFDDPDLDPYYDSDSDHDSDDDPDLKFVFDSDLNPDFDSDSGPDLGSYPNPDSYCILCTDYDFSTNDPDTWTRFLILR
ncbi:hypothetical protein ACE6H2_021008 [Prunus campanulata]